MNEDRINLARKALQARKRNKSLEEARAEDARLTHDELLEVVASLRGYIAKAQTEMDGAVSLSAVRRTD
jgi:hypothetical protein